MKLLYYEPDIRARHGSDDDVVDHLSDQPSASEQRNAASKARLSSKLENPSAALSTGVDTQPQGNRTRAHSRWLKLPGTDHADAQVRQRKLGAKQDACGCTLTRAMGTEGGQRMALELTGTATPLTEGNVTQGTQ